MTFVIRSRGLVLLSVLVGSGSPVYMQRILSASVVAQNHLTEAL